MTLQETESLNFLGSEKKPFFCRYISKPVYFLNGLFYRLLMEFYLVFSDRVCLLTNTVQLNHITFSNVPTFRLLDLESDKTGLTQCGYWN